jgi:tripartite-type tricarboxylate transporter receptor subunit TctC
MKAVIAGDVMAGINNLSDAFRAASAGNVKILAVADLERNVFLPDVPTMMESGLNVDNASVNFRGVMVPKGTPQGIIDKLAATVPSMFENKRVAGKMKAGGSPMHIMTRDEVLAMWAAREVTLKELLAGL